MKYDLVLYNGKIYSLENEFEYYKVICIKKGIIVETFKEMSLKDIKSKKFIDLKGKTVLPGLIDNHAHFTETMVTKQLGCMISEIKDNVIYPNNISTLLSKIKEEVNKRNNKIFIGFNVTISALDEQRLPNKFELDEISDKPIVLYTTDGHSSSLNTSALMACNIESETGILDGKFHEDNQAKLQQLIVKNVSAKVLAYGLAKAVNECLSYGITGVGILEGSEKSENDVTMMLISLIATRLPLNMYLFPQYLNVEKARPLFKIMKNNRIGGCGNYALDGAIGSHSAAFDIPYKDDNKIAKPYYDNKTILEAFKSANDNNASIKVHAIGSDSIKQALDCFETIIKEGNNSLMHSIEHCEFPYKEDIKRIKEMNLNISIQPGYFYFDNKYQHSYKNFLTDEVMKRVLPVKTMYEMGINITTSSDSPVQEINPFLQIKGLVEYPVIEERLSLYQALRTYTVNASKSLKEDNLGLIKKGYKANFSIHNTDIFNSNIDILNLKAQATYINGKIINPLKESIFTLIKLFLKRSKKI